MSAGAKALLWSVIAAGATCLLFSLSQWNCTDYTRFFTLLLVAVIASQIKLGVPGASATLTATLLIVFIAIVELSLGEAVVIALASAAVQVYWRAKKRPRLIHLLFNAANFAVAVVGCRLLYGALESRYEGLGQPIILALSAGIYFCLNTFPIASIVALTEGGNPLDIWQKSHFWSFAYYLAGATLAGIFHFFVGREGWQITLLSLPLVYLFYRSYQVYTEHIQATVQHAEQVAAMHFRTMEVLAVAAEAKDETTHDHLRRVQTYALGIGRELGLSETELKALQAAAILHDIGKLAVPEAIISKPGKLTPEEFEIMKIHPIVGAEIVELMEFPYAVAPIVRAHHEKWNGSGYPDGLKAEEIPLGARILTAVDCLDGLASDRQYRRALPLDKAMEIIVNDSGKSFDPVVVEALERRYMELAAAASASSVNCTRLSINMKVERGAAPDAGFESSRGPQTENADPVQQRRNYLETISTARTDVRRALDLVHWMGDEFRSAEILQLVSGRLQALLPHDSLAIFRARNRQLAAIFTAGHDQDLLALPCVDFGAGLAGWVAENAKPMLNGNPSVEPGAEGWPRKTILQSALAAPVIDAGGAVMGVLAVYQRASDAFQRNQVAILESVARRLVPLLAHSEAAAHPAGASTDPATGLLDGVAFFASADAAIQEAAASGAALSFLLIEVFCLHQISNQLGRAAGARILNEFAQRLRTAFRGSDVIGRLGSEEFAVLAVGAVGGALETRANHLAKNLTEIFGSLCPDLRVTAAVGVSEMPQDGQSLEELLAAAEARLPSGDLARLCQATAERLLDRDPVGSTAAFLPARNLPSASE
ncbi:MAG TPA: HD domain-containing phosphohydrolase [Bryobacteraceae bacterium]|jgi:diguanylate cyclase (GGDEF)-like protein/putative nucleotidyltransferase with HDIG domain